MKRYFTHETSRMVIFPYRAGKLIDPNSFRTKYPLTWSFLNNQKKYLENREGGKQKGSSWYGYSRTQALTSMEQKKLLTPDYYAKASYCLDSSGKYFFFGGGAGGYGIVIKDNDFYYVLGLLNSKLLDWFLHKISVRQYQTAYSYVKKYIEQLPIRTIDFSNPADVKRHDRMVALVQRMLDLHKQTPATPFEQERLARDISATDAEIDRLVYELYELTPEEVKIVEG